MSENIPKELNWGIVGNHVQYTWSLWNQLNAVLSFEPAFSISRQPTVYLLPGECVPCIKHFYWCGKKEGPCFWCGLDISNFLLHSEIDVGPLSDKITILRASSFVYSVARLDLTLFSHGDGHQCQIDGNKHPGKDWSCKATFRDEVQTFEQPIPTSSRWSFCFLSWLGLTLSLGG